MRNTLARFALFAALFAALLLPCPARAQDLGNVGLRSVAATLANGVNCTGSAQTFSTSSSALNALGFRNLGQTQHFVTANPGTATNFQVVIQGVDTVGTVFSISDYGEPTVGGVIGRVTVQGSGTFANIQVQVTCSPITATFVLNYSGGWVSPTAPTGSAQMGQIDKYIFAGAAATSNQTGSQFQTPFGSTSGTVLFAATGGGTPGTSASVTISCQGQVLTSPVLYSQTLALANSSSAQSFQIPPNACPLITVAFVSGGAASGTFNLEYIFNLPGVPGALTGTSAPQMQTAGADPCMGSANVKSFALVNTTASAQLIAGTAGKQTYVCSLDFIPAAADNIALVEGTGATCGTGTAGMAGGATAATGWNLAANENVIMGDGSGSIAKTITAGDNVCILASAATQLSGNVGYVQQ